MSAPTSSMFPKVGDTNWTPSGSWSSTLQESDETDHGRRGDEEPLQFSNGALLQLLRREVEEHDGEYDEHHDRAGVEKYLKDEYELRVEHREEPGQRGHGHDERERPRERALSRDHEERADHRRSAEQVENDKFHGLEFPLSFDHPDRPTKRRIKPVMKMLTNASGIRPFQLSRISWS